MSRGADRSCCNFCCTFIFTSGLTALFLWLSLRTSNPTCSIQRFDVPALNKTANATSNHTLYFDLKLDNKNKDKGIYYDTLNLTFYYGTNKSQPIGNFTVKSFYQGHHKKTHRKNLVDLHNMSFAAVSVSDSVSRFRVDLETAVRFKIMGFKTKRHKMVVWALVDVNDSGQKAKKKGIKLKSGAPEFRRFCKFCDLLRTGPVGAPSQSEWQRGILRHRSNLFLRHQFDALLAKVQIRVIEYNGELSR